MKKYFRIFIILSTFAVPASGEEVEEIKITTHQNSSIQVQHTLDKFCDSDGYVEKINGTHIGSNGYVPSLGEIELQCKQTGNGIVIVRCYKYKKLNDTVRNKIRTEFAYHCDTNKKKTSQVNIENDLTRPDSHLSQAELCKETDGEWTDNKCTCKPQNGTYYKFDKVGGCYIEDEYRTKQEAAKTKQREKIEQQKQECEKFDKNKWNGTKCVCKDDVPPDFKMQNGRCSLTQQGLDKLIYERECDEADGTVINKKCKCNDKTKIYDPETKSCISKTANYDAAIDILKKINSALDTTMAKFNKPQE